jgi:hypothetical protein
LWLDIHHREDDLDEKHPHWHNDSNDGEEKHHGIERDPVDWHDFREKADHLGQDEQKMAEEWEECVRQFLFPKQRESGAAAHPKRITPLAPSAELPPCPPSEDRVTQNEKASATSDYGKLVWEATAALSSSPSSKIELSTIVINCRQGDADAEAGSPTNAEGDVTVPSTPNDRIKLSTVLIDSPPVDTAADEPDLTKLARDVVARLIVSSSKRELLHLDKIRHQGPTGVTLDQIVCPAGNGGDALPPMHRPGPTVAAVGPINTVTTPPMGDIVHPVYPADEHEHKSLGVSRGAAVVTAELEQEKRLRIAAEQGMQELKDQLAAAYLCSSSGQPTAAGSPLLPTTLAVKLPFSQRGGPDYEVELPTATLHSNLGTLTSPINTSQPFTTRLQVIEKVARGVPIQLHIQHVALIQMCNDGDEKKKDIHTAADVINPDRSRVVSRLMVSSAVECTGFPVDLLQFCCTTKIASAMDLQWLKQVKNRHALLKKVREKLEAKRQLMTKPMIQILQREVDQDREIEDHQRLVRSLEQSIAEGVGRFAPKFKELLGEINAEFEKCNLELQRLRGYEAMDGQRQPSSSSPATFEAALHIPCVKGDRVMTSYQDDWVEAKVTDVSEQKGQRWYTLQLLPPGEPQPATLPGIRAADVSLLSRERPLVGDPAWVTIASGEEVPAFVTAVHERDKVMYDELLWIAAFVREGRTCSMGFHVDEIRTWREYVIEHKWYTLEDEQKREKQSATFVEWKEEVAVTTAPVVATGGKRKAPPETELRRRSQRRRGGGGPTSTVSDNAGSDEEKGEEDDGDTQQVPL